MKTITVIQPSKTEQKMLRVAAYCRVSSSSEDQLHSFKAQNAYYRTLIANTDGWTLADIYADEGITGTSAEKRPGFQRLMADCRKGKIDLILAKSISRFARNTKDCIEALRELKRLSIAVRFEKEGIDTSNDSGEMLITMMSAMAQEESISISQNMRWSYQKRMQAGTFITCLAPFGYSLSDGKLIIIETEAALIRTIYKNYLSGMSMGAIAEMLSDEEIKWNKVGIRYILTNERYMGDALLQKFYSTDTIPFKKLRNDGSRDQYYVENSHEAIISREQFYAVQTLIRSKRIEKSKTGSDNSLLKKYMRCEYCGSVYCRYTVRGKAYWTCRTHYDGADKCPAVNLREDGILTAITNSLNKLRYGVDHVLEPMLRQLTELRNQSVDTQSIDNLKKEEYSLKEQNRLLADLQVKGHLDSALYAVRKQKISKRLDEIREAISAIQSCDELNEKISATAQIIEQLRSSPEITADLSEKLFTAVVSAITIKDNTVTIRFINGLTISERVIVRERKKK